MSDSSSVVAAVRRGDRRALARLLTSVEDGTRDGFEALAEIYPDGLEAWTIGVTGSPGAGKSTLVDGLVHRARAEQRTAAVIAIDPSSPFTGGALLGDRVRMQSHAGDDGVYLRSMANRGHLGGIAESTPRAVAVLAGAGFDEVVIETVGVGQAEVDVAAEVDTVLVVVNPRWGDAVQAAKAGILEIADVFVVNKADLPGTDETTRLLTEMIEIARGRSWRPPIIETVATEGVGLDGLALAIDAHRAHLVESGALSSRRRAQAAAALRSAMTFLLRRAADTGTDEAMIDSVAARTIDPWSAARALLGSG